LIMSFNNTVSNCRGYTASKEMGKWLWWVLKNLERRGHGLYEGNMLEYTYRHWYKTWKTSVRIAIQNFIQVNSHLHAQNITTLTNLLSVQELQHTRLQYNTLQIYFLYYITNLIKIYISLTNHFAINIQAMPIFWSCAFYPKFLKTSGQWRKFYTALSYTTWRNKINGPYQRECV
jgi:hypothetical protein